MIITQTFTNAIATFGLNSGASSNYATAHGGNSPTLNNFNNTIDGGICNSFEVNYFFRRYWFHFNTAVIPDSATIVSAFLRIPGTSTDNNNTDSDTIGIYESTVASNDTLAEGDWTSYGATLLGSLAMASYNNAANNDIALNGNGLSLISKTGYSKFMIMTTKDKASEIPTGINNQTFNATGLVLSVTYSTPDDGAFLLNFI